MKSRLRGHFVTAHWDRIPFAVLLTSTFFPEEVSSNFYPTATQMEYSELRATTLTDILNTAGKHSFLQFGPVLLRFP